MKHLALMCITLIFALQIAAGADLKSQDGLPYVVSTQWLAEHLHDPSLVILQVSSRRKAYLEGHIPGSQFLWPDWFAMDNPDMSYELLPVSEMKERLENLGVSDNSTIVLCFTGNEMTITSRIFFTLDYLGLGDHTRYLDGGVSAWKSEKREITTEIPTPAKGLLNPHVHEETLTNGDWIADHLHDDGVRIVDARSSVYYTGANPTFQKKGHIPGAVSIPFSSLADTLNKFKEVDTLKAMFLSAGVKTGDMIIPYCHVGQQASLVYFVAKNLGYSVSFYDGAFEDWATRKDAPVEATKIEAVPQPKKGEKIVYVCSMDADVVKDKPGNCPKCGMVLEAKAVPVKSSKPKKSKG